MKKHILFILTISLFAACTKDFEEQNTVESKVFNVSIENGSGTKVHLGEGFKSGWDNGDRVAVFAGNTFNQEYMFNGTTGDLDSNGQLIPVSEQGSGAGLGANYAVYPYDSRTSISTDGVVSVSFPDWQRYEPYSYGIGANTMVAVSAGIDDDHLFFKNACGYLRVSLYGTAMVSAITLTGNNGEMIAGDGTIAASFSGAPEVTMSPSATTSISISCNEGMMLGDCAENATDFCFVVPPVVFSQGLTIRVTDNYGNIVEKSTSKSIAIIRNTLQKMAAFEVNEPAAQYVDLGLSVKWAAANIGSRTPEGSGDYYAWGATEPLYESGYAQEDPQAHWKAGKSAGYCWNNAPFQTNEASIFSTTKWTKYLASSSSYKTAGAADEDAAKVVLEMDDDVAHAELGDSWRMPTAEEWKELMDDNNCSWTWTTQDGVNGYKVQSKKAGYTDNWIFLPASGRREDCDLNNNNIGGYYWSSSVYKVSPFCGEMVSLKSSGITNASDFRGNGLSIRPVYAEDPNAGVTGISVNKSSIYLIAGYSESIEATVSLNSGAVNGQVQWLSSNPAVATVNYKGKVKAVGSGVATITAKTAFGGYTETCKVYVASADLESVDLGLSVKWANRNLGSTSPEKYGDYYAWGATEPWYLAGYAQEEPLTHWKSGKSAGYKWVTAPFQTVNTNSSSETRWTKYLGSTTSSLKDPSATDANAIKTVLDLSDDAARAVLGGNWRMPTREEWRELVTYCSLSWINLNGVYGTCVISEKPGYTDRWIFLPAGGGLGDGRRWGFGTKGCYWSSTLGLDPDPIPTHASAYSFYDDIDYPFSHSYSARYNGSSIRPVSK